MPVKFYPTKPVNLLEKYILKEDGTPLQGEIDIYRKLYNDLSDSKEEWHIWHDLKLPTHSIAFNSYSKTSVQIDFLILCKHGIMIMEVKGGAVSFKNNRFYYGKDFKKEMPQDPFRQAEGYKFTLKECILNNIKGCFFCEAVAMPHVDYQFESKIFDSKILWTKYRSSEYGNSIKKFIEDVFRYGKEKHKKYGRHYPELNKVQMESILKILSPIISNKSRYDVANTLDWLQIENIEILEGLYKNSRIMIEGPPGSGKTTIAKAYIDQQKGKKGLFLCWNNLLMNYTKEILRIRKLNDNVEVTTLFQLLKDFNPNIKTESLLRMDVTEFNTLLIEALKNIEGSSKLPMYDFIVVDEAQDLFDRGIDLILEKLCGYNQNGLENGNILLLYDVDQSYKMNGRNVAEIADILSEYFAHFRLNEIKRSAQNPDIKLLSTKVLEEPKILVNKDLKEQFKDITVSFHENLEAVKKYIVNKILNDIRSDRSSLHGGDCIVLVESKLLQNSFKDEPGMHYWLTIKDVEELSAKNVADRGNKLRYTSILKFKGLEKNNVFIVSTSPSQKNKYELYVGMTRAIANVEIMVIEE